jgi:hypothetical protein
LGFFKLKKKKFLLFFYILNNVLPVIKHVIWIIGQIIDRFSLRQLILNFFFSFGQFSSLVCCAISEDVIAINAYVLRAYIVETLFSLRTNTV